MTEQVQLQLLIPELTLGTNPLDWAPTTKQTRKKREANFIRMCDACGKNMPSTGWRPGDLCSECIPETWLVCRPGSRCGELFRPRACECKRGECEAIPW